MLPDETVQHDVWRVEGNATPRQGRAEPRVVSAGHHNEVVQGVRGVAGLGELGNTARNETPACKGDHSREECMNGLFDQGSDVQALAAQNPGLPGPAEGLG